MPRFATTEYGGGGGEPIGMGQSRGNGGGETIEIEVPVMVTLVGGPIVKVPQTPPTPVSTASTCPEEFSLKERTSLLALVEVERKSSEMAAKITNNKRRI
jgi:hypothetical protein